MSKKNKKTLTQRKKLNKKRVSLSLTQTEFSSGLTDAVLASAQNSTEKIRDFFVSHPATVVFNNKPKVPLLLWRRSFFGRFFVGFVVLVFVFVVLVFVRRLGFYHRLFLLILLAVRTTGILVVVLVFPPLLKQFVVLRYGGNTSYLIELFLIQLFDVHSYIGQNPDRFASVL